MGDGQLGAGRVSGYAAPWFACLSACLSPCLPATWRDYCPPCVSAEIIRPDGTNHACVSLAR
ncbi:hypothetical protein PF008_g19876 [Phytophthora fragariae]|uniref:Uncharacterized protein n=1 Tax=Phytophthora fragariae TaxID=53985 RepID=A0A6G0R144_9STRA|nr:hypothetical protein PF008_g19876 [Phytophthora fragariae]